MELKLISILKFRGENMNKFSLFKIIDITFIMFALISSALVPIDVLFFHKSIITATLSFWVLFVYAIFLGYFGLTGLFLYSIHLPVSKYIKYSLNNTLCKITNILISLLGILIILFSGIH